MSKTIIFNDENRNVTEKIKAGVSKLANAVKVTLGPSGRVVLYEREMGSPIMTKDGVTVAKEVELSDPFENMGAQMIKQAASKTADIAGDGTTTATIYAEAIFLAGIKQIGIGVNPQKLKRGIEDSVNMLCEQLSNSAKPVIDLSHIEQVAMCSSNHDDDISNAVTVAMDKIGNNGVVTIEESSSDGIYVDLTDGIELPRGYMSPLFVNNKSKMLVEYDDPNILLINDKLYNSEAVLPLLQYVLDNSKPLVIICDDVSDTLLDIIASSKVKHNLPIVVIKSPGTSDRKFDTLEDLAIFTGGNVVGITSSLLEFSKALIDSSVSKNAEAYFGTCDKIKISPYSTTIIGGNSDDDTLSERIELLESQLENVAGNFEKEIIQDRLSRLTNSVARISVGGATEVEMREKKDRVEDALSACKAATKGGFLPGGGCAVLHAWKKLNIDGYDDDYAAGVKIVEEAIKAPLSQIAYNTGKDAGVVVNEILKSDSDVFGYNAEVDKFGDMIEFGIIVPTLVEQSALKNASSVASLLLTADCAIAINKTDLQMPVDTVSPSGLPRLHG